MAPEAESLSYELPHQIYYYGDPDNYVDGLLTLLRDALIACDQQDTIRMGDYDVYIIFHAGASYQASYVWGDAPFDILSCSITGLDGYFGIPVWVDNGTHPITDGIIFPESDFKYGVPSFIHGGLCHEFSHQLGMYDLYDVSGYTIGVGGWALMGTGNWNMNGLLPSNISAWNREFIANRYECVPIPTEIKEDTTDLEVYFLGGRDCSRRKSYKIPINSNEYYLIQNRQAYVNPDTTTYRFEIYSEDSTLHVDSTGIRTWKDGVLVHFEDYDWGLPPDSMMGGLAIWHIDDNKVRKDSSYNEINVGDIKGVDMEEADGVQDFETKVWLVTDIDAAFYGSPYDVFYNENQPSFTPMTIPNTNDNKEKHSHIHIYNVTSPDTIMRFSIKFDFKREGFPVRCGSYFDVSSPAPMGDCIVAAAMDTLIEGGTTFGGRISVVDSHGDVKWSRIVYQANLFASPAIGDIDGDTRDDIVVCPFYVYLYVTDEKEKVIYRRDLQRQKDTVNLIKGDVWAYNDEGERILYLSEVTDGAIISTPLLADVDFDGKDEIFFGCDDGYLYGYRYPGESMPGFPINMHQWIWATPVWDSLKQTLYITSGDGRLHAIFIPNPHHSKEDSAYIMWSALEPFVGMMSTSSPVVKYGDGIIVSRGDGRVFSVSDSGTINWKRVFDSYSFYSSPAICGGRTYIVTDNIMHQLNENGTEEPGFPMEVDTLTVQSSPVVGDIDGDGVREIVIGLANGSMVAYTEEGELVDHFPLSTGEAVLSTPLLCDIDRDGYIDILAGCDDGLLYGWEFPWNYGEMPWPMLHQNPENNGICTESDTTISIPTDIFEREEFYVYPNPVMSDGGWIRYTSGDADKVNIAILDITGNIKCEFPGEIGRSGGATQVRIPIEELTGGLYILRVEVLVGDRLMVRVKKFSLIK